ncbi:MAG: type II secretion system protein GspC [Bdellovibrionia bacterium]
MNAPKKNKNTQFPLDRWYPYGLAIIIGFFVADLTILAYRDLMLPTSVPPAKGTPPPMPNMSSSSQYSNITARNIFSADGIIPEAITAKKSEEGAEEAPAVLSQLPLNLIGTMVFSNPEKSLAAIELKGKNLVVSLTPGKEIENMAKIELVERHRVTFRNLNNGRLEYIEMKNDNKVVFGAPKAASAGATSGEVVPVGENQFTIKRANLLKYINDLPSVLMQARAVPYREPGTGNIVGFRILDIQPGSIFSQLGLNKMDIIKGVNGSPVDSPAKAMELFHALKGETNINIQIDRNGKNESFKYDIKD